MSKVTPAAEKESGRTVVLLDLNYTLVGNQAESREAGGGSFDKRMEHERYRKWLKDLIQDRYVIIITARPVKYREKSLENIRRLLDWQPAEAYFNEKDLSPPECKRDILERYIFPKHGRPGEGVEYIAIESNPRTAEMYSSFGIPALRVWDERQYGTR